MCVCVRVHATGMQWAEARDAAEHLKMHRAASKNYLAPEVSGARPQKPWLQVSVIKLSFISYGSISLVEYLMGQLLVHTPKF